MPRRPETSRPDLAALAAPERLIVLEEEALLARVLTALRSRRPGPRPQEVPELLSRLKEFREEAAEAAPKDLPTVFQEMGVVRALLDRRRGESLPEAASPYFALLTQAPGAAMRDAGTRFFAVEHTLGMIVAIALVHVGRVIGKRSASPNRYRTAAILFAIALVIFAAAIPWPAFSNARPLLRW